MMKKIIGIIPKTGIPGILLLVSLIALVFSMGLRINASSMGSSFGDGLGKAVGKAAGSLEGVTEGREAGIEAGQDAGLSAEDTEADIATRLKEVANLEVLVASVKLNDFHSIGKDKDYAALYLLKGDAIFSVDLSDMDVSLKGNELKIVLPQPKVNLIIDESQTEKVAEYQKHFFSGSAAAGMEAYLNTMKKLTEEPEKAIANYDFLMESARESAEKQVRQLASSVSIQKRNVSISFR